MLPLPLALRCCEEVSAELSEYLDGELARFEAAQVEIHLVACERCARLAAELAAIVAAIRRLAEVSPPSATESRRPLPPSARRA
jgi:anti-sigma factor RsiW